MLSPWVAFTASEGAPAETLLERVGIEPELLQQPTAAIPVKRALCWVERAGESLGTELLGAHVGSGTPIEALGTYGLELANALTLHHYVEQGVSLYRTLVRGQTIWLSAHGNRVRVNLGAAWKLRPGDCQARLNFLAITVANIRRFAGPLWSPTELSVGFKPREPLPLGVFGDAPVVYRPGQTYFEFPRPLLGLRLHRDDRRLLARPTAPLEVLPNDLAGLVKLQIASLLSRRTPPVDLIAESLGMSRRSLQRGLAEQGISYTDLLTKVRLHRAAEWLEHSEKPVVEIAFDLGYADASNFTRAFRQLTGVTPSAFRRATERG